MNYLISMFIDNEMNLTEKVQFIEKIHSEPAFCAEALALLSQEKMLRQTPAFAASTLKSTPWRPSVRLLLTRFLKPLSFAAAGFACAILIVLAFWDISSQAPLCPNRFVLFEPDVSQVELVGTFTGWQRVPMQRVGNGGYWTISLPISYGEHRFAYILDGRRQIADPSLRAVEQDDFGGQNSIINLGERI